ncbi:hypothetical protein Q8W37_01770 [Shimia thalassica]|jgi:hypothetical protein|uniref:hypothetical protein n=1 Tax=Shimia thalassica TaxID=1715693 RepID=UPI000C086296|nr:hypothetical protein [Shimia thalassica]PHO03327.1 hypothetical protein CSC82_15625 [Rhodobacteraceae bacterium 4F10]MBU2944465.1 hypothetical protein [Shimia thalassica]MDO6479515.1 hypothetical protein [Shimia thalassica]MDO6482567.1 hypothetical protein [Shimia thalassica]MDO6502189.1 hypothetical protein [Shimia thalassica]
MSRFSDQKSQLAGLLPSSLHKIARKLPLPRTEADVPHFDEYDGNITYRDLTERIDIPVNLSTPDQMQSDEYREKGLYLARQDRWDELSELIMTHDHARDSTRSGLPIADLLAFGARSDVVRAAEHGLLYGRPARGADFFSGIEALEMVLMDDPRNYGLALIVAHMHIDIGWAWRGAKANDAVQDVNRDAFEAHFDRAHDILSEFCPHELQSPALSAARCALLPGRENPAAHLVREFEALIDLDPFNPRHMRSLGNYLLPRWYGNHQALDLEARRTAARTYDIWGAGAYTWVWFDALLVDPNGFDTLEMDYFMDGIRDILKRSEDQHVVNLIAAHLYQSWQIARERYHANGVRPDLPPALRRGFEELVYNHLREVHPLIWGHAEIGFENTARVISTERLAEKGRETALTAVAMPFLATLQQGQTVSFGPDGISESNS